MLFFFFIVNDLTICKLIYNKFWGIRRAYQDVKMKVENTSCFRFRVASNKSNLFGPFCVSVCNVSKF